MAVSGNSDRWSLPISGNEMIYTLSKIAEDVRVALDQNMVSTALEGFGDVDTLSLNDIISSKIIEGVRRVHLEAPAYLFDYGDNFGEQISLSWSEDQMYCGWTLLPDDFMRFVVFEMTDWERPVYTAIDYNDPLYDMQSARYKGLRGTPQKPVCVITIKPEGRALEFYSCRSNSARVKRAIYIPYPSIDADTNSINIYKRCYEGVIYTIGSLVLASLGDIEKSNLFAGLAKSVLM